LRVSLAGETQPATFDATNLGWESLAVVVGAGGGFLDVAMRDPKAKPGEYQLAVKEIRPPTPEDSVHVEASVEASAARRVQRPGTTGAVDEAAERYGHALSLWRQSRDSEGELMTSLALATLEYARSQYSKGAGYAKEAFDLARRLNDRAEEALAANNWAMCETPLGLLDSARDHMIAAAAAFEETGSLFAVAAAKNNLGALDYQSGRWSDSLAEFGEARALARQIGEGRLESVVLNHIAEVYIALGDATAAAQFLGEALVGFRAAGDVQASARAVGTMGRLRLQEGQSREGEQFLRQAVEQLKALSDRRAEADAVSYLGQALEHRSPVEARVMHERALSLYQAAQDRRGESDALCNLGKLLVRMGEVEAGIDDLRRSLAVRREIAVFDLEAESLYALAVAERSRGNSAEALANVEEAIRHFDSARRQAPGEWLRSNYMATRNDAYRLAVKLQLEDFRRNGRGGGDARAFLIHDRMLARSLVDRLGISWSQIVRGVDPALLARSQAAEKLLYFRSSEVLQVYQRPHNAAEERAARSRLEAALAEYRLTQAQIRAASPAYRKLIDPDPASIPEIQDALADRGLLLEFWTGEPRNAVWAVSESGFRCYLLPAGTQMERAAEQFVAAIREGKNTAERGRAMGQSLRAPVSGFRGRKRLMIVAEGKVAQVPFAAVEVQEPGAPPRLLVEAWQISMLPSAQAAVTLRRQPPESGIAEKGLAVLADPVFSTSDERLGTAATQPERPPRYERLAFSREEADAILAVKPSRADFKAFDSDANVETAKRVLGAYRYVHFSTHAQADAAHPELSAVVLSLVDAKGKQQDGMLRLSTILETPVRAHLVVLSACEGAAGREIRAEGMQSLTQAFILAGARQVISSPWPVDDFVSRQFMPRFYEALLVQGLPPEAALRAAQLSMIRTRAFGDPAKWAVFSLYGLGE